MKLRGLTSIATLSLMAFLLSGCVTIVYRCGEVTIRQDGNTVFSGNEAALNNAMNDPNSNLNQKITKNDPTAKQKLQEQVEKEKGKHAGDKCSPDGGPTEVPVGGHVTPPN